MTDYPYYRLVVDKKTIISDFRHIARGRLKKINSDDLILWEYSILKHLPYIKITDYFSENCRARCRFSNFDSMYNYYKKNESVLLKKDFQDYWELKKYIYDQNKGCTNFPNLLALQIYRYFKPTKILDFSAGWGDRLIAALAYGKAEYTGVDPSVCMAPRYKQIVNFFTSECPDITGDKDKYKVFKKPFEQYKVKKNYYDLVFTSPPFFDYEIYEKENKSQSINKYKSFDSWKKNFMFPALEKSLSSLREGGHLALYIEDYKGHKYVGEVKRKMRELGDNQFLGCLTWYNKDRRKKKIRRAYVWKKINS